MIYSDEGMARSLGLAVVLIVSGCSTTPVESSPPLPSPVPTADKRPTAEPGATTAVADASTAPRDASVAALTDTPVSAPSDAPEPAIVDPIGWFEWRRTLHGHGPDRPGFRKRLRVFADGQARYFEEDDEELMPGMKAGPLYCGGTVDAATKAQLDTLLEALVPGLPKQIHPPTSGGMSEQLRYGVAVRSLEDGGSAMEPFYELTQKIRESLTCDERYRDAHNDSQVRWPGDDSAAVHVPRSLLHEPSDLMAVVRGSFGSRKIL